VCLCVCACVCVCICGIERARARARARGRVKDKVDGSERDGASCRHLSFFCKLAHLWRGSVCVRQKVCVCG